MATSLRATDGIVDDDVHIRVYDDCSTSFDNEYLRTIFPEATEIVRRGKNLGANGNMHQMHHDFLATGDDVLLYADADLIFHPDWLRFAQEWFPQTDNLLRIYNSAMEPALDQISIGGQRFILKEFLASAGILIHRDLVGEIIERCQPTATYDWDWTRMLRERGHRLIVSPRSYVQHIGMNGYNSDGFLSIDWGTYFIPGSEFNEDLAIRQSDELLMRTDSMISERIAAEMVAVENHVRYDSFAYALGVRLVRIGRPINELMKRIPGLRWISRSIRAAVLR